MTWHPISEWPSDGQLDAEGRFWEKRYLFFSGKGGGIFGPHLPRIWIEAAHLGNQIRATHWWDGENKPKEPPQEEVA